MTAVVERPASGTAADEASTVGRLGPLFAGIWLFFLLQPLLQGWSRRDEVGGVLGMVVTVGFAAAYLALWVQARRTRTALADRLTDRQCWAYLCGLGGLAVVDLALLGESALACTVYLAVACVILVRLRVAIALVLTVAVATAVGGPLAGWGNELGLAFAICAASVAVFGVRSMIARNVDLVSAQRANSTLAVENERTRFARDLHDILGHSLTVITVKAELAGRLIDVDLARARAEIADLERLSRDALVDVRRAVDGYRELTLPGELVRARTALGAAEIRAEVPNSTEQVPSDLREVFAWTVREGVTNVIRHSRASRCEVLLSTTSAEVRDDGDGGCANADGDGHGLAGLRERAAAAGATVVVRHLSPGFSLSVTRGEAGSAVGVGAGG